MYTIEKAIECAKREAHIKQTQGKLFTAGDDSQAANDFTNGDPETIYSIAALYAQYVEDLNYEDAQDKIIDALTFDFPDYI
jgi:hypothetical protein